MKVLALVTFSSSALSMAQGEIADVAESVANPLIEVGYLEKWVNPVMTFYAHSPTDVLTMHESGGGDDTPTT